MERLDTAGEVGEEWSGKALPARQRWLGQARSGFAGVVRSGLPRQGKARVGRHGVVGTGEDWQARSGR